MSAQKIPPEIQKDFRGAVLCRGLLFRRFKIFFKFVDRIQKNCCGISHARAGAEAADGDHRRVENLLSRAARLIGIVHMDDDTVLAAVIGCDAHADQLLRLEVPLEPMMGKMMPLTSTTSPLWRG